MSLLQRVSVALLACAACVLVSTTFASERSFVLTPDPGFALVDLKYHGGQTGANSAYTLYADGKLVAKRVHHGGAILAEVEHQVEAADVDALIQLLIDAGLFDSNQKQLEQRMGPKRLAIASPDSPTMHVTVALQWYQRSAASDPTEVRVSYESLHPFVIARYFRDIEEVQCLDEIARWFRQYRPTKREK